MKPTDVSNALLLRASGELSPSEEASLEAYLQEHPEAKSLEHEYQLLQEAGNYASKTLVPGLSELEMERILHAGTRHPSQWVPKILAVAAAVVLLLLGLPFLSSPSSPNLSPEFTHTHVPMTPEVLSPSPERVEDLDLWDEVDQLEAELAAWQSLSLENAWLVEDEASWAAEILVIGDSI